LAGLLAGLLYAFCGPLLFYNLLPLGEGPAVFFLLAGLVLLFAAARPAGPGEARGSLTAWLAGAMLALAALIRPNLAPAVLLALAAWCLAPDHAGSSPGMSRQTRRARLSAAGRCLAGLLLVFAPFMAHNAAVAGRPSPFGFQGGFTLYTGNHSGASGVGDALPGFDNTPYLVIMQAWAEARARTGLPLSLADADAYWYGRTWDFFAGHPAEAAGLFGPQGAVAGERARGGRHGRYGFLRAFFRPCRAGCACRWDCSSPWPRLACGMCAGACTGERASIRASRRTKTPADHRRRLRSWPCCSRSARPWWCCSR
jgi:hypothetical protein